MTIELNPPHPLTPSPTRGEGELSSKNAAKITVKRRLVSLFLSPHQGRKGNYPVKMQLKLP
ncbi:MAG: hypothetical protein RLO37_27845 [Coleofasciculus chthonoplastes F1-TOW-03]